MVGGPALDVTSRYSREVNCPVAGHQCTERTILGRTCSRAQRAALEGGRQLHRGHAPAVPAGLCDGALAAAAAASRALRPRLCFAHQGAPRHDALQVDQLGQELRAGTDQSRWRPVVSSWAGWCAQIQGEKAG